MKIIILALLIITSLHSSYASIFKEEYSVGLFKDSTFDPEKITHVIIVGSAVNEDSDQFFQSGISKAYRIKETWPDHQVVIISSPEVKGKNDDEVFKEYNVIIYKTVNDFLNGNTLIHELNIFQKIASIDFFGHSSPWGLKLNKYVGVFDPNAYAKSLSKIKSRLLPNAYAILNSCNSGFTIAPDLSRILEIPVAGSLTSSVFERIQSDGFWYKENDWTKDNYVEINSYSYNEEQSCSLGLCWRMKPSRNNYSSYWGQFNEGGLSFYKFFCNFDNNQDGHCEKGMANSLYSFPSRHSIDLNSKKEDFKKIVFDWICSTAKDQTYYNKCVAGITNSISRGDLIYQSHPGNELICDFKSCNAKVVCKDKVIRKGPKSGSCKLITSVNNNPTTAAKEMLSFLKGFELLNLSSIKVRK